MKNIIFIALIVVLMPSYGQAMSYVDFLPKTFQPAVDSYNAFTSWSNLPQYLKDRSTYVVNIFMPASLKFFACMGIDFAKKCSKQVYSCVEKNDVAKCVTTLMCANYDVKPCLCYFKDASSTFPNPKVNSPW